MSTLLAQDLVVSYDFGGARRYPSGHCWDTSEPKLLACETRRIRGRMLSAAQSGRKGSNKPAGELSVQHENIEESVRSA